MAEPLSKGLVGKSDPPWSSIWSTAVVVVPLGMRLAGAEPAVTRVPLHGLSQSWWQQEQVVHPPPLPMVEPPALFDLVIVSH